MVSWPSFVWISPSALAKVFIISTVELSPMVGAAAGGLDISSQSLPGGDQLGILPEVISGLLGYP